jgi:hypothetical protein
MIIIVVLSVHKLDVQRPLVECCPCHDVLELIELIVGLNRTVEKSSAILRHVNIKASGARIKVAGRLVAQNPAQSCGR